MEQSLDKKPDLKFDITSFLKKNKFKIITLLVIFFVILVSYFILIEINKNKNVTLSEKYIQAGFFLSEGHNDKSRNLYNEIINEGNSFYSLLALNQVLEKNLINDKKKIQEYFTKLESLNYSKETLDLIQFKKALYLMKIKEFKLGEEILKELIKKNSNLKKTAQELIK